MKLLASRSAQYPLLASFALAFNNWVTDSVDLSSKTLGSTLALSTDPTQAGLLGPSANTVVFECLPLPPGAVITGGELIVETAYVGPTAATLSLGTAAAPTALLAATDLKTVARTPLVLTTPLAANDGSNIRMTLVYTAANATAGKARVRIMYTIDGRSQEACIA
jgi:hypothetical protein